jgi:hypothetical protein
VLIPLGELLRSEENFHNERFSYTEIVKKKLLV